MDRPLDRDETGPAWADETASDTRIDGTDHHDRKAELSTVPGNESRVTNTTCPYCGVGCGVLAEVAPDGSVAVRGDPDHPANYGRLCSKGSALAETLALDDRLLHPVVEGRRTSWDEALDLVASRFNAAIADHGPDSVAFYVSGQLLTEDYYVANKLMKGFIGSGNIDTNSRLCMSSSVAGHKRAFGSDTVPGTYADLEEADLIVLVGSNFAWCHPVLFQRVMAARQARDLKIVVIDPRRTPTADQADLHLPVSPDGDVALFNGLLRHLASQAADSAFVEAHTTGIAEALGAVDAVDDATLARSTGLAPGDLARFFDLFAATERVVTVYSQGVNQSVCGTDKVNAIINCHLVTGRIGRPGMGPFSITGQPNAMGGREVGGLANQLAAHLDIDSAEHRGLVADFWASPRMAEGAGLKAVDLFRAVADGRVKALWIMGTNPVDSMPEADRVREALRQCPFVVCSDVIHHTDTTAVSRVLLPAAAWGEKDGTVTNSERRITRQRSFLPMPGEARPDWWIVAAVARRMGFGAGFGFGGPGDIFREHAALSAYRNGGQRDFDIGGLADLGPDDYDELAPVQWPVRAGETPGVRRFFGDGQFFTPDRRGRFVPVSTPKTRPADPDYPLSLNTGRIRDQWHTMTRTGKSARLSTHLPEPFLAVHPDDARMAGLEAGGLAICESAHGRFVGRVQIGPEQARGAVFAPMHWTDQYAGTGRVDALVAGLTDPYSGQPASKITPVRIRPYRPLWYGFAVCRTRPVAIDADYWAAARVSGGWQIEMAGMDPVADWTAKATDLFGLEGAGCRVIRYDDAGGRQHRRALLRGERLEAALFIGPTPLGLSRSLVAEALTQDQTGTAPRMLLAGRPGAGRIDKGETVCSCFQIGANQIRAAILEGGCTTVAEIGATLRAGTNCGSCRPEIGRILSGSELASSSA